MTSATSRPAGVQARHTQGQGYGLVMFAFALLLGLNAIDQMFFVPAYPFWSLVIIAADIVAIWGLCASAYSPRQPAAEPGTGPCRTAKARDPGDGPAHSRNEYRTGTIWGLDA